MKRLALIRLSLVVFWRDLVSPGAGLWLILVDPKLSGMRPWQAPVVAGLLGFPLAARGLTRRPEQEEEEEPPTAPEPVEAEGRA